MHVSQEALAEKTLLYNHHFSLIVSFCRMLTRNRNKEDRNVGVKDEAEPLFSLKDFEQ